MSGKVTASIRVGIGGWVYAPWRGNFYPKGLVQARELEYASRHVTSIEINGTFYGTQKPSSFARWRDETPDDFVFALKGPRYATHRRVLAEAGPSIEKFLESGLVELKHKLGPINWQFAPTKTYEEEDFAAFLALLPQRLGGLPLRHAVEVRHDSFATAGFVELLRRHGVAAVVADKPGVPHIHDATAPFVYARLQSAGEDHREGYAPADLDRWTARARSWARGHSPADLPLLARSHPEQDGRPVFLYMINGFKPKAPAAAMALLRRLADQPAQ
ncbi:hypothetical protein PIGHUM_02521 [Pigmentiphaga humi]|uniref:DUF72 domain-containing protein n=1 Tax=Pigmentiphaga humi TaxID=2478468 RepID=A0A3P4B2E0_9BURK|nr:DUF72 domain-containing protein [Pigmentiphaga humi]VCU70449.1 hypothetical protein PIGHUM_02521 [Pigmentiphaga humi]